MACEKFIHIIHPQTMSHIFYQTSPQLVLQHAILQDSLYQFLKNLLLINILSAIHFLFAKKLKIKIP